MDARQVFTLCPDPSGDDRALAAVFRAYRSRLHPHLKPTEAKEYVGPSLDQARLADLLESRAGVPAVVLILSHGTIGIGPVAGPDALLPLAPSGLYEGTVVFAVCCHLPNWMRSDLVHRGRASLVFGFDRRIVLGATDEELEVMAELLVSPVVDFVVNDVPGSALLATFRRRAVALRAEAGRLTGVLRRIAVYAQLAHDAAVCTFREEHRSVTAKTFFTGGME